MLVTQKVSARISCRPLAGRLTCRRVRWGGSANGCGVRVKHHRLRDREPEGDFGVIYISGTVSMNVPMEQALHMKSYTEHK